MPGLGLDQLEPEALAPGAGAAPPPLSLCGPIPVGSGGTGQGEGPWAKSPVHRTQYTLAPRRSSRLGRGVDRLQVGGSQPPPPGESRAARATRRLRRFGPAPRTPREPTPDPYMSSSSHSSDQSPLSQDPQTQPMEVQIRQAQVYRDRIITRVEELHGALAYNNHSLIDEIKSFNLAMEGEGLSRQGEKGREQILGSGRLMRQWGAYAGVNRVLGWEALELGHRASFHRIAEKTLVELKEVVGSNSRFLWTPPRVLTNFWASLLESKYLRGTVSLDGLSLEGFSPLASDALLGYDTHVVPEEVSALTLLAQGDTSVEVLRSLVREGRTLVVGCPSDNAEWARELSYLGSKGLASKLWVGPMTKMVWDRWLEPERGGGNGGPGRGPPWT